MEDNKLTPIGTTHRKCPFCATEVSHENHGPFRDEISFKEFQISGICQKCQDETFGV